MSSSPVEVDIVKRGYLRYKITSPNHTNAIKSFKDYWFIFRTGVDVYGRILECYTNEKESKRNNVKDRILLNDINSVTKLDSSKQFCLYSNDGTVHTFEAPSAFECGEWLFSLNAVLFGKGPDGRTVVQFAIEVWSCPMFRYSGPGVLEIRHDLMIVWSEGERNEIVRWQLGHIRSFKAKPNQLQIIAGSRSSTGEGIFVFGTQESVLITHTLETVINLLAQRKQAMKGSSPQSKRHSTRPPIPPPYQPVTPIPPPYQPVKVNQTLVRGRTDTNDLIPGFTDVPGIRGPEKSLSPIGKIPQYQPNYEVIDTPTFQESVDSKSSNTIVGNSDQDTHKAHYSLLRAVPPQPLSRTTSYNPTENTTSRIRDIYSDHSLTYDKLDTMGVLVPSPKPQKCQTLPSPDRNSDYNYVDTIPKLLPLPLTSNDKPDSLSSVEFGVVRHLNSPQQSRKNLKDSVNEMGVLHGSSDESVEIYSTIKDEDDTKYAFLKPVNEPSFQLPEGTYNSLNFNDTTSGDRSCDQKTTGMGPGRDNHSPIPSYSKQTSVPPSIPPYAGSFLAVTQKDIEVMYADSSPVLIRKKLPPTPDISPRVSPIGVKKVTEPNNGYDHVQRIINTTGSRPSSDKISDDYDEVDFDNTQHHFIETKNISGGYSKFNRSQIDSHVQPQQLPSDASTYSSLPSQHNNGATLDIYNVLDRVLPDSHKTSVPFPSPLFDGDYSEVPNALTNPDPDIKVPNNTTPVQSEWRPFVPPRGNKTKVQQPKSYNDYAIPPDDDETSPVDHGTSPIRPPIPPKPKPKPIKS